MEWITLDETWPTTKVGDEYFGGLFPVDDVGDVLSGDSCCFLEDDLHFLLGRPMRILEIYVCLSDW